MQKSGQFPDEAGDEGEFARQEDAFRDWVSDDTSTQYPAVAGRYHLYVSLACPWASRTVIARKLIGLERALGMSIADPIRDERGWTFAPAGDPANQFIFLRDAYLATNPSFNGRVTVPVLWDNATRRIVNNSEDDICRMFNDAFAPLGERKTDLFPADIAGEQTALSKFIYENVNNGVYKAGFATTQRAYDKACHAVFAALDELDSRLTRRRYLFGPRIVETDWRLFCTLIRFDPVYHGHFKCNIRRIIDYRALHGYMLDLYQQPGIAETVNLDHIKRHYYATHREINPTGIVPLGPVIDLTASHGRERLVES